MRKGTVGRWVMSALLAAVIGMGVAEGQAAGTATRGKENGRLSGVLEVCCNAQGSTPEPGVVVIRARSGTHQRVKVPRSGRFSLREAPGRYRVVGGIPSLGWRLGRCRVPGGPPLGERRVRIYADNTTHVAVICQGQ